MIVQKGGKWLAKPATLIVDLLVELWYGSIIKPKWFRLQAFLFAFVFEKLIVLYDVCICLPQGDGKGLLKESIIPRAKLPPLLCKLSERPHESLDYMGVSYGLTKELLRFWKRAGYQPVYLRQVQVCTIDCTAHSEATQMLWKHTLPVSQPMCQNIHNSHIQLSSIIQIIRSVIGKIMYVLTTFLLFGSGSVPWLKK